MEVIGIGERLKEIRNGHTLAEFSEKLGVHKNTLARYEREDSYPDAALLNAFCTMFGISPMWILQGEGPIYMSELRFYFLKEENREFDFGSGSEERAFKSVISSVDNYFTSSHYRDASTESRAKTYFLLYAKYKDDKSLNIFKIAQALSECVEPSFCIYDLDINEKIINLSEFLIQNNKKISDRVKSKKINLNSLSWEIRDYIMAEFCSYRNIAPNRIKSDIFKWIEGQYKADGFDVAQEGKHQWL